MYVLRVFVSKYSNIEETLLELLIEVDITNGQTICHKSFQMFNKNRSQREIKE